MRDISRKVKGFCLKQSFQGAITISGRGKFRGGDVRPEDIRTGKDIEFISGISRETSKSSDEVPGASTGLSGRAASLQDIARQFEV